MNPPVGFTDPVSVASKVYKYHRFDPELVEQLVSIYRIMFPHNGIPDEFYEHVVRKIDEQAAQNQALPGFLSDGVEALNGPAGSAWTDLSEEARLQALKLVEQSSRLPSFKGSGRTLSFTSTVTRRSGPCSDTKGRPMTKAVISIAASTTSIGSKERSFNLWH